MTQNVTLEDLTRPPADAAPIKVPSHILETIALRFLARVIHADGVVDPREVTRLVEVAMALEMTGEEARRILDDEFSRKSDPAVLAAQVPERVQRRELYAMGCFMGMADGEVADAERDVLAQFARGAEIPPADAQAILDEVIKAARNAQKQA